MEKPDFRKQTARNIFSNLLSRGSALVAMLFLIPIMIEHFGEQDYGIWILVGTIVANALLLDFGIPAALTKHVSAFRATGRLEECRNMVITAVMLVSGLGALIFILLIILTPWLPGIFKLNTEQATTAQLLFTIASFGITITLFSSMPHAILQGLHRYDISSMIDVTATVVFVIGVVLSIKLDISLVGIAIFQVVVRLAMLVVAMGWVYRLAPELIRIRKYKSGKSLNQIVSFSWAVFLLKLGGHLQSNTDEIVISSRLPVATVASYSAALKLSRLPQILLEQILAVLMPMASAVHAQNDSKGLEAIFIINMRLTIAVFLSLGLWLVCMSESILNLWLGESFGKHAPLVQVLVLASFFGMLQWPGELILQGMNRHRIISVTSIISGVLNILLSFMLIPFYGVMGVAIGTLVITVIEFTCVTYPISLKRINVKQTTLWRHSLGPSIIPALALLAFSLALLKFVDEFSFMLLLLSCLTSISIFTVIYLQNESVEFERGILANSYASLKAMIDQHRRS